MKPYTGQRATLRSTAAAGLRLIVWCKECQHQVEPDPAEGPTPLLGVPSLSERRYFRSQYPAAAGKTVWQRVAWGAPSSVSAAARQTA